MDKSVAEQLVLDLYQNILDRKPGRAELEKWITVVIGEVDVWKIVKAFYSSIEYQRKKAVKTIFPAGHYHSPVVDPATVKDYVSTERSTTFEALQGVAVDVEPMRKFWLDNLDFIQSTPFTDEPSAENRYSYVGGPYPWGDAITLRMMIGYYRPQRIVEIGSGYSTACMLDSAEHASLPDFHITCIEPYPERLRSLLKNDDFRRVTLIERPIQEVSSSVVDGLERNDILFIDSTHVMKTGSDVHYEFFHLIPRLKPGVIVHFHDVGFPFEYPDQWIFDLNYSWNEAYVLRAFLMFNREFRVLFWNSLYARRFSPLISQEYPTFLRNPGSSIWIERVASLASGEKIMVS